MSELKSLFVDAGRSLLAGFNSFVKWYSQTKILCLHLLVLAILNARSDASDRRIEDRRHELQGRRHELQNRRYEFVSSELDRLTRVQSCLAGRSYVDRGGMPEEVAMLLADCPLRDEPATCKSLSEGD